MTRNLDCFTPFAMTMRVDVFANGYNQNQTAENDENRKTLCFSVSTL